MEHYFSENPKSKLVLKKIKVKLDIEFEIFSASGLFSKDKLDKGTKLLIENTKVNGKLLDLGCGNGVIGIYFKLKYKKQGKDIDVTCSDINKRAIAIVKKNAKLLNLDIKAVHSNGFENINDKFDTITLNPPMSAGKETVTRLINDSFEHLNEKGRLYVVVKSKKGGKIVENIIAEKFKYNIIAKGSGYEIIEAIKLKQ